MNMWEIAAQAAQSKQAEDIVALDISEVSSFADTFVLCSGSNSRQNQAIGDAIRRQLKAAGLRPLGVEGFRNAVWILLDYGDFVIHVQARETRLLYDLERLWKNAPRIPVPQTS
jgi:ribosome-associated protein